MSNNIIISNESITLSVFDGSGPGGFNHDLDETVTNTYFSLPGVIITQPIQYRGMTLEIDYETYKKIGIKKYKEMVENTHRKLMELDDLYTSNRRDFKEL